jgi:hypothetical protein
LLDMVDRSGAEEAIGAAEAAPRSPRARSRPADVFISYASPDGGVVDAVCGALERDGLERDGLTKRQARVTLSGN